MVLLSDLKVKIFADGADIDGMLSLNRNSLIKGMTTNPTLMAKAGIKDFEGFSREILASITVKPVSLEVFSDEFSEMYRQAKLISGWGKNVFVKIPITNTHGESSCKLIKKLSEEGVQLNVTALLHIDQVKEVSLSLNSNVSSVVSVFAGRVADTGRDPSQLMRESKDVLSCLNKCELLWASVREVLNIFQADAVGCDIVTVPHDILSKALKMADMDLLDLSLDTVKMFYQDATKAGYTL